MEKQTAIEILAGLKEARLTIALNHLAWLAKGEIIAADMPAEIESLMLAIAAEESAKVTAVIKELDVRIACAQLAIDIIEMFEV